jgi:hypothetical protein
MLRFGLGAALVLLLAAGCGDDSAPGGSSDGACTEIGCLPASAQVQVSGLPEGSFAVRVCADERCKAVRGRRRDVSRALVELPEQVGKQTRVVIEVRQRGRLIAKDAALIPIESHRPNGPDCPPVCLFARGRLDLDTGRLDPS